MRFEVAITKDWFRFDLSASTYSEKQEAQMEALLVAMREGLEANGFDVQIEATYTTRLAL